MRITPPRQDGASMRRGMLLMIVLSILALFVVVGAAGIVMAIRAREAARAFASASAGQAVSTTLARAQLDEALLKLIRGPSDVLASGIDVTENLLEDKFGTSQIGTITWLSLSATTPATVSATSTFISGTITGITSTVSLTSTNANPSAAIGMGTVADIDTVTGSYTVIGPHPASPAAFVGRVLTLVPGPGDPTAPTSHRILAFQPVVTVTTATTVIVSNTFWTVVTATARFTVANGKPATPLHLPLSTTTPIEAVLNGREFCPGVRMRSGTFDPAAPRLPPRNGNEPYDAFDDRNPFLTQPVLQASTVTSVQRPAFQSLPPAAAKAVDVDNDGDGVLDGVWLSNVLPRQVTADGRELAFDVSYLVLDLDGRVNLNAHGSFVRAQAPISAYPPALATVPLGMGYGPADVDAARLVSWNAELLASTVPARWPPLLGGGVMTTSATESTPSQLRPTPWTGPMQQWGRYGLGSAAPPGGSMITGTNPLNADFWMTGTMTGGTTGMFARSPTDLNARLQVYTSSTSGTLTLNFFRPSSWMPPSAANNYTDTSDVLGAGAAAHPYRMRLDMDAPRGGWTNADDSLYTVGELERILRPFDSDAATLEPRLAAMLDDFAERSRMTITTDSWDTPAITGSAAVLTAMSMTGPTVGAVHSPEIIAGLRFNLNRPVVTVTGAPDGAARQDYFRQLYTLIVCLTGTARADDAAQWVANVIEFRDPDSTMTWYPYDTNPLDGVWTTGTGVWGAERPEMVITSATSPGTNQVSVTLYRPWAANLVSGTPPTVTGMTERIIDPILGNPATNTLDVTRTNGAVPIWRLAAGGTTAGLNTLLTSATTVGTNTVAGTTAPPLACPSVPTTVVLQRLANPAAAFEPDSSKPTYNDYVPVHSVSLGTTGSVCRWLHWPNRDLVSHGELLAVQSGNAANLADVLLDASGGREASLARDFPVILDATIVPSRFTAANVAVANGPTYLAGTGYQNFQYGQLSNWREAGRVNVNTILPNAGHPAALANLDDAVWTALVGRGGLTSPVVTSGTIFTDQDLLTGTNAASPPTLVPFERTGPQAASAFLRWSSAVRLANVATTRSHVFAVWITLRITDTSPMAGPPRFARLFAIVDRSIPVAYVPGRTLNVRETIRLKRYLE